MKYALLSLDKGNTTPELKTILEEFGDPIRSKIADELIKVDFEERIIDEAFLVKEITSQGNKFH